MISEKHQICALDFVSYQGTTLTLIGMSAVQLVCVFDVYLFIPIHLMAQNLLYFRNVLVTKFIGRINVVGFSWTIKI